MIDLKRCILDGHLQNDPLDRQKKRANHADQEYQVEFNHFFFCFRKGSKVLALLINNLDTIRRTRLTLKKIDCPIVKSIIVQFESELFLDSDSIFFCHVRTAAEPDQRWCFSIASSLSKFLEDRPVGNFRKWS